MPCCRRPRGLFAFRPCSNCLSVSAGPVYPSRAICAVPVTASAFRAAANLPASLPQHASCRDRIHNNPHNICKVVLCLLSVLVSAAKPAFRGRPDLVKVIRLALVLSQVDFGVIEGLRPVAREKEMVAEGHCDTKSYGTI